MKKVIQTLAAALLSVVLFFSFTMPVYAGDVLWLDDIFGWSGWWNYIFDMSYEQAQASQDNFNSTLVQVPDKHKAFDNTPLTYSLPFYTGVGTSVSGDGSSGGGARGNELNAYNSGNTVNTSIVNKNYNSVTNNYDYTLNMPTYNYNNVTNNYYTTYDIQNIYYNNTYNTYLFETTNNYYYYIDYSPTYVNITYLDSGSQKFVGNVYYYQLPDGRNTFDLKAADVWGQYFIYDYGNYDLVIEDIGTQALYHFDGNLNDVSAQGGTATYVVGGSHNYVEHGAFDTALYLDNGAHGLQVTGSGSTYEFMLYLTAPGTVNNSYLRFKLKQTSLKQSGTGTNPALKPLTYFLPDDGNIVYLSDFVASSGGTGIVNRDYELYYKADYVLNVGGTGYLPVYEMINLREQVTFSNVGSTFYTNQVLTITGASTVIGYFDSSSVFHSLGVGTWHYIALSGGKLYVDGVSSPYYETGKGSLTGTGIYKPATWSNYWTIDEFRISSSALYTGNYMPSSAPFDTNKVLVLPEGGGAGQVAIKSSALVTDLRVGGVRPTYPDEGNTYVNLEKKYSKRCSAICKWKLASGYRRDILSRGLG